MKFTLTILGTLLRRLSLAALLPLAPACAHRDNSRDAWLQHRPTSWTQTAGGHVRDAGPFASVAGGWETDADIDAAVDAAYAHFAALFPGYPLADHPLTLNDDYVMWIPQVRSWAGGVEYSGEGTIGVTLWSRIETGADPGPCFIARPPGNYWGVQYAAWRHTGLILVPAVEHELLHAAIGDPGHTRPEWALLSLSPRPQAASAGGGVAASDRAGAQLEVGF